MFVFAFDLGILFGLRREKICQKQTDEDFGEMYVMIGLLIRLASGTQGKR